MAHFVSERFNVAWFKLAEFVHRKEKERALAMYRLLFHSLSDVALLSQLEGDLLLAFKDDKAFEVYKRSATQYEESGRILEAALLYEHVAKHSPEPLDSHERLMYLYTLLEYEAKKTRTSVHIARILFERKESEKLDTFLAQMIDKNLNAFLTRLAALDAEAHVYAKQFLKRSDD